ncbi:aminotransferase class V-fold PLP-dependent enzyme [Candidatus Wolfebacteria bacterium]|nr:aminotransferase class V-fold PLP-dependent enzyme [Candidatus Wolfebacteria bacterium]
MKKESFKISGPRLENYFKQFRENIIGINQTFSTSFGKKRLIYTDWTATGRLYRPIEEKISRDFGPFVGNTHTEATITGASMAGAYQHARRIIKEHVGAKPTDVIITAGSGMTGVINKFQRILGLRLPEQYKSIILATSDRPVVFTSHFEHHSNQTSWLETIAEVVIVPPDQNGEVSPQTLSKLVEKFKNRCLKIGAFSACSNVTGIRSPVHQLARLMHQYEGLCFVDYAASAPYVAIEMHPQDEEEKLDAIYFSPHKFLGGPGTPGVLIFDSKLYQNQVPDNPGGGTVAWANPWGGRHYFDDIEIREDGGTPPFLQTIKAAICIKLKEKMNIEKMEERKKELLTIIFDGLERIKTLHILAGNIKQRQGIISFYVDGLHYNLIAKLLNDRFGIQARAGCSCAGTYGHYLLGVGHDLSKEITDRIDQGDLSTKPGWVRLSIHPTATDEETGYVVEAVREIVRHGKTWQEDYGYDSRTNEFIHKKAGGQFAKTVAKWFEL